MGTGALIKSTAEGSIAREAGIEKGDTLLSVNGQEVSDILLYRFLTSDETVELEIQKKDGTIEIIEVYNEDYEDLGIEFENELIDNPRPCRNKCIFCFVDQLPKGMRKTLYFKDDDFRLSALMGNYITLTNLSDTDIENIIKMRLPRINVSVHAADPKVRSFMLGNKNSDVIPVMKRFAKAGTAMNCQIVLCRGINDGDRLDETINELSKLYPSVQSVSVVPVGLTKHRLGLTDLTPYDENSAREVISRVWSHGERLVKELGSRFVFLADEFYMRAGMPVPDYSYYEDFLQIENGVGLVAALKEEFYQALKSRPATPAKGISIATGVDAAPVIKSLADMLGNNEIKVYPIKNKFFGESITVTGLITGRDLIDGLAGKSLGDTLVIARCMLNSDGVFLDDLTVEDVQNALGVKIKVLENNGAELYSALTIN
ncbi:MAG: hypothetical protein BWY15_00392 [Firmicutes bacterium ADurb.Bin193]|nr:MAG: hypothetical protein BWY15_00392 [Firmicutes bacterium ADurb.Bin193]